MNRRARLTIAVIGTGLVCAYAVLGVVIILVLNPLAAAPGLTLTEIAAAADAAGEQIFTPVPVVFGVVGIALAVLTLVAAATMTRFGAWATATSHLGLLVLGLPAYFVASFGPGMSVADTFATGGADHSGLEVWLSLTSGVAAVLLAFVLIGGLATRGARADLRHASKRVRDEATM